MSEYYARYFRINLGQTGPPSQSKALKFDNPIRAGGTNNMFLVFAAQVSSTLQIVSLNIDECPQTNNCFSSTPAWVKDHNYAVGSTVSVRMDLYESVSDEDFTVFTCSHEATAAMDTNVFIDRFNIETNKVNIVAETWQTSQWSQCMAIHSKNIDIAKVLLMDSAGKLTIVDVYFDRKSFESS